MTDDLDAILARSAPPALRVDAELGRVTARVVARRRARLPFAVGALALLLFGAGSTAVAADGVHPSASGASPFRVILETDGEWWSCLVPVEGSPQSVQSFALLGEGEPLGAVVSGSGHADAEGTVACTKK